MGHEFAGEIAKVGAEVTGLTVGDRVTGVPIQPCGRCRRCAASCGHLCEVWGTRSIAFGLPGAFAERVRIPDALVEEVLLGHPDVTDCAVVGLPDERWGEVVAALVATTAEITETDLQDWARRALAGYKIPRRISLRGQLPRSPTGKLELARVRELLDRPPRE